MNGHAEAAPWWCALLVPLALCAAAPAVACEGSYSITPPTFDPHVGFAVSGKATLQPSCSAKNWHILDDGGEATLNIDSVGGLINWTPSAPGPVSFTIAACKLGLDCAAPGALLASHTFNLSVSPNTMTWPISSAYLQDPTEVDVTGSAYDADTGDGWDFEGYRVDWKYAGFFGGWNAADPAQTDPSLGDGWYTAPVDGVTDDLLATWDISGIPDGSEVWLRLQVRSVNAAGAVQLDELENEVIIDRTAVQNWPKFHGPSPHSALAADLDGDGVAELIFAGFQASDSLAVWSADGTGEPARPSTNNAARGGVAVGDVLGDGQPELVAPRGTATGSLAIYQYQGPGADLLEVAELSLEGEPARAEPLLVDFDNDGNTEVVVASGDGRVLALEPMWGTLEVIVDLAGRLVCHAPSTADLNGDGRPEIVFSSKNKVYAFTFHVPTRTDPGGWQPLPGWYQPGRVPSYGVALDRQNKSNGTSHTGVCSEGTAKPAIADIDGDGALEVVVGNNVIGADGAPEAVPAHALAADPGISAAIGQLDGIGNGLEVVVGHIAWHGCATLGCPDANEDPLADADPDPDMSDAIIVECGFHERPKLAVMAGLKHSDTHGIVGYEVNGGDACNEFPKQLFGSMGVHQSPVLTDVGGDGQARLVGSVVSAKYGAILGQWSVPYFGYGDERLHWTMYGHDPARTGAYAPPRPNRPVIQDAWGNPPSGAANPGLHVTWTDRSGVEQGYVVEVADPAAPFDYAPVATASAGSGYAQAPLAPGDYLVRVRAWRSGVGPGATVESRPSASLPVTVPVDP